MDLIAIDEGPRRAAMRCLADCLAEKLLRNFTTVLRNLREYLLV
jgi:hypothetical protein